MMNKQEEIEAPMKEVAEFYLKQDGVLAVHYIKRTHRQKDFNAVKEGGLANPSYKDCVKRNLCPILGIGEMKMRMQVYRGLG